MSENLQKRQEEELLAFDKKMAQQDATTSQINNEEKNVQFALSNLDLKSKGGKEKEEEGKQQSELDQIDADKEAILRKKEKNRLKKERKKQKEEEAELAKEQEKKFLREIDPRLLELQSLRQQLMVSTYLSYSLLTYLHIYIDT